MRPVTVFVLLLFATGVVGGELYGRTLTAGRLAQLPVQHRVAACTVRVVAPAAKRAGERSGPSRSQRAPRTRHRRIVGRGLLPALRAGPAA
jgi:hypothetical protein